MTASALASAQNSQATALKTGYAPVNGLKMYYEIYSAGEPLVRYTAAPARPKISAQFFRRYPEPGR